MAEMTNFPSEFRDLFHRIWDDIASLHAMADCYYATFGKIDDVRVLNCVAADVFILVEEAMRNEIVMAVGRLLDRSKGAKRANLSLQYLIDELPKTQDQANAIARIEVKLQSAKDVYQPKIGIWRNRRAGHRDLKTAMLEEKLPRIGKADIDLILVALSEISDAIQGLYEPDTQTNFHPNWRGTPDALVILAKEHANAKQKARESRCGHATP